MPASTRKMTAKSEESSSSDNRDPEKNDEGNEDRKEDNMGLSNNNSCTSSNVTAKSSSDGSIRQHISEQGATKQQQLEQPEQQQQQDEEERATKSPCQSQEPKSVPPTTSSSSSSQSNANANANANANTGTQTSSTPSRHTVHTSSQRHLFSPPPSSVKVSFSLISLISIATLCYTTALHCIVLNRSYFQKANGHSRLSCNDIYLRVARKIYLLIICLVIVCCVLYSTCMRSHLECIVNNTL